MTAKIEVNELPTGTITVEIPFQIIKSHNSSKPYDWRAVLPNPNSPDYDDVIELEGDEYFATPAEALNDIFDLFGVERGA